MQAPALFTSTILQATTGGSYWAASAVHALAADRPQRIHDAEKQRRRETSTGAVSQPSRLFLYRALSLSPSSV